MPRYRVGIDTGGTFTDVVAVDNETGLMSATKTPSSPDDPSAIAGRRARQDRGSGRRRTPNASQPRRHPRHYPYCRQRTGSLMPRYRVGIDTGGTFTDVVAVDNETSLMSATKTPSTPDDPSRSLATGLDKIMNEVGGVTQMPLNPSDIRDTIRVAQKGAVG